MPKPPRPPSQQDVEPFDSSFRWFVRSRTSGAKYLVDLSAYGGNGRCSCKSFEVRMQPILSRGKNPADAVEVGILKLQPYHLGPWQACMCHHIIAARSALTDAFISTLRAAEAKDAPGPRK